MIYKEATLRPTHGYRISSGAIFHCFPQFAQVPGVQVIFSLRSVISHDDQPSVIGIQFSQTILL